MKALSLIIFWLCLNMAAFILHQSAALPIDTEFYISPFDITNQFSITVFGALATGGTVLGVLGLITKQYVFASIALLIWIIGILLPIAQWFLVGAPIVLAALLPTEISWITYVISAFFAFTMFMFLAEIATQRQIT